MVSCDIPIRLLGLSVADVFAYIFDFGDYHTFRITVLDIQSAANAQFEPAFFPTVERTSSSIEVRWERLKPTRSRTDHPPSGHPSPLAILGGSDLSSE